MEVYKIPGTENPADLMTKVLSISDIVDRLKGMNIEYIKRIFPKSHDTDVSADMVNVIRSEVGGSGVRKNGYGRTINVYIG